MSEPALSEAEGNETLKRAFPENTPTIEKTAKGSYRIMRDGVQIGGAFDLRQALRPLVVPIFKEMAERAELKRVQMQRDLLEFLLFLKEKHDADFQLWRNARKSAPGDAPASAPERTEPDQKQLVQIVSG